MSTPANTSFQLWKGDTLRFTMSLKNSGSAYAIPSGTVFEFAVKEKGGTSTYDCLAEITSSANGTVLATIPTTVSSQMVSRKNWVYDVQMTQTGSIVTTLLYGNIFVNDEVTT